VRVAVDDVLTLIKQMCNLRATWEEATAGLEKQAAASD
jgi:glycyl-tRNA synthetase